MSHKYKMDLKNIVKDYPNFPKKGIIFKDIWPLLENPDAFEYILSTFQKQYNGKTDAIAGIESRGFVFGAALANRMKLSFIPIRKKGKLPGETLYIDYEIEYGNASMEIQKNILKNKKRIVIIDDLLATGGTSEAAIKLLENIEIEVNGLGFVIELKFLNGRKKINKYDIFSILSYD